MSQYQTTLLFSAPLEKVWAIWMDVEKTPEWVHGVQSSEPGEGEPREGFTWKETCLIDNMPVPMEHCLTLFEPYKKTVIYTELPLGGNLEKTAEFESIPEGTRITISASWELGMIGTFLSPDKVQEKLEEGFRITAENWKARSEKN